MWVFFGVYEMWPHVCMYGWMDRWLDGWVDGWMSWLDGEKERKKEMAMRAGRWVDRLICRYVEVGN